MKNLMNNKRNINKTHIIMGFYDSMRIIGKLMHIFKENSTFSIIQKPCTNFCINACPPEEKFLEYHQFMQIGIKDGDLSQFKYRGMWVTLEKLLNLETSEQNEFLKALKDAVTVLERIKEMN